MARWNFPPPASVYSTEEVSGFAYVDAYSVNTVSPADLDLLSAWLDNQLAPEDRAALEARLSTEPALRAALNELQWLVSGLRALPNLRAPADMRLTAAQVKPARRIALFPAFVSGLSAVAAAVLLIAGVGLLRPLAPPALPAANEQSVAAAPTAFFMPTAPETSAARELEVTALPTTGEQAEIEFAAEDGLAGGVMNSQSGGSASPEQSNLAQAGDSAPAAIMPAPETAEATSEALADTMLYEPPAAALNPQATLATAGAAARTKEETPTASPSATITHTPAPSATLTHTPAPSATAEPAVPPEQAGTEAEVRGASVSLSGIVLIGGGMVLLGLSLAAWRRARRAR